MPRRRVDVDKAIRKALEKNKTLTWSQLAKETSLSKASLSRHLNSLIRKNIISTRTEKLRGRSSTTYYSLNDNRYIKAFMYIQDRLKEEESWLEGEYITVFFSILQECEQLGLVPHGYFIKSKPVESKSRKFSVKLLKPVKAEDYMETKKEK